MTLPKSIATSYDERFAEIQLQEGVKIRGVYQLTTPFTAVPMDNDPKNMRFLGSDALEVLVDAAPMKRKIGFTDTNQENEENSAQHIKLYDCRKNVVVDYLMDEGEQE